MRRLLNLVLALCLIAPVVASGGRPAAAWHGNIKWPALESGSKGADVTTLQRFLNAKGYWASVDGQFGSGTISALRRMQSAAGLTPDGIANASTWSRLYSTVSFGSTGPAVCALQEQLNVKHGYQLPLDCKFGSATHGAVRAFQAHMGIAIDGIVGPQTWQHLIGHFENLNRTGTAGYGWVRYGDDGSDGWGTANTIAQFKRVAALWAAPGGRPRLQVGDISRPHGGYFAPHVSHQRGVDIDVLPIRKDGKEGATCFYSATYSRPLTQALVNTWLATGQVDLILFNDPQITGVRWSSGHDCHLHIRLKR